MKHTKVARGFQAVVVPATQDIILDVFWSQVVHIPTLFEILLHSILVKISHVWQGGVYFLVVDLLLQVIVEIVFSIVV